MRQSSVFKTIMVVIFCLAVGCIGGYFVSYYLRGGFQTPMAQGTQIEIEEGSDIATVAQTYQDAVVSIKVQAQSSTSLGSGVCVHAGGYIVTNYHVVEDAKKSGVKIYVFLNGDIETGYQSELLWANNALDLAIIKCQYTDIKYAKMKDRTVDCEEEDKIKIGEEVISIGTPIEMTLQNTTTFGRVNGTGRVGATNEDNSTMRIYEYLIQHQATINSGNSGGPLIDSNGFVVGINSCSMVKDVKGNYVAGVDFAVPIYPVIKVLGGVVEAYEEGKDYVEPILAISISDKTFKNYKSNKYSLSDSEKVYYDGNYVKIISQPYGLEGLQKDDEIVSMSYDSTSYNVTCVYDFYYNCLRAGSGTSVTFAIERNGRRGACTIVLP